MLPSAPQPKAREPVALFADDGGADKTRTPPHWRTQARRGAEAESGAAATATTPPRPVPAAADVTGPSDHRGAAEPARPQAAAEVTVPAQTQAPRQRRGRAETRAAGTSAGAAKPRSRPRRRPRSARPTTTRAQDLRQAQTNRAAREAEAVEASRKKPAKRISRARAAAVGARLSTAPRNGPRRSSAHPLSRAAERALPADGDRAADVSGAGAEVAARGVRGGPTREPRVTSGPSRRSHLEQERGAVLEVSGAQRKRAVSGRAVGAAAPESEPVVDPDMQARHAAHLRRFAAVAEDATAAP